MSTDKVLTGRHLNVGDLILGDQTLTNLCAQTKGGGGLAFYGKPFI